MKINPAKARTINSWFNSPYYDQLYNHRNEQEAAYFIRTFASRYPLIPGQQVLDLACGKGRYSRQLHQHGLQVTGIDLAGYNIESAKRHEQPGLSFYQADMREPFAREQFHWVFNMFTSLGYFNGDRENQRVIEAAEISLLPGGYLVIDFLNPHWVKNNLVPYEEKMKAGINFTVRREIQEGYVYKYISFTDKDERYNFTEQVQLIHLPEFKTWFRNASLEWVAVHGNYQLNDYDKYSPRMIMIAKKNK